MIYIYLDVNIMDEILSSLEFWLSFIAIVLIPFLLLLINDLRKFFNDLKDAAADGKFTPEEALVLLEDAGVILRRIFVFWKNRQ